MCLIRLKRYHFRLKVIHYLSKPSAKMPAHIVTKLHVLMPGAFNAPYKEIIISKTNPWKENWSTKMLQHKRPQVGSNFVNPLYTQCETSQNRDYRNASYSLIYPLCIISDPIAMAKLNLYHKIMFLISAIKVTPKVMQWLQSCLEDHVLHLEIDGVFSKIICTKLDCTLRRDEHLKIPPP